MMVATGYCNLLFKVGLEELELDRSDLVYVPSPEFILVSLKGKGFGVLRAAVHSFESL